MIRFYSRTIDLTGACWVRSAAALVILPFSRIAAVFARLAFACSWPDLLSLAQVFDEIQIRWIRVDFGCLRNKFLIGRDYLVKAAPLCSAGFEKIISTPALRLGSIFFPKALPVIAAFQERVLNKKPEMAPAERQRQGG